MSERELESLVDFLRRVQRRLKEDGPRSGLTPAEEVLMGREAGWIDTGFAGALRNGRESLVVTTLAKGMIYSEKWPDASTWAKALRSRLKPEGFTGPELLGWFDDVGRRVVSLYSGGGLRVYLDLTKRGGVGQPRLDVVVSWATDDPVGEYVRAAHNGQAENAKLVLLYDPDDKPPTVFVQPDGQRQELKSKAFKPVAAKQPDTSQDTKRDADQGPRKRTKREVPKRKPQPESEVAKKEEPEMAEPTPKTVQVTKKAAHVILVALQQKWLQYGMHGSQLGNHEQVANLTGLHKGDVGALINNLVPLGAIEVINVGTDKMYGPSLTAMRVDGDPRLYQLRNPADFDAAVAKYCPPPKVAAAPTPPPVEPEAPNGPDDGAPKPVELTERELGQLLGIREALSPDGAPTPLPETELPWYIGETEAGVAPNNAIKRLVELDVLRRDDQQACAFSIGRNLVCHSITGELFDLSDPKQYAAAKEKYGLETKPFAEPAATAQATQKPANKTPVPLRRTAFEKLRVIRELLPRNRSFGSLPSGKELADRLGMTLPSSVFSLLGNLVGLGLLLTEGKPNSPNRKYAYGTGVILVGGEIIDLDEGGEESSEGAKDRASDPAPQTKDTGGKPLVMRAPGVPNLVYVWDRLTDQYGELPPNSELAERLGCSPANVAKSLQNYVEGDVIEGEGTPRKMKYRRKSGLVATAKGVFDLNDPAQLEAVRCAYFCPLAPVVEPAAGPDLAPEPEPVPEPAPKPEAGATAEVAVTAAAIVAEVPDLRAPDLEPEPEPEVSEADILEALRLLTQQRVAVQAEAVLEGDLQIAMAEFEDLDTQRRFLAERIAALHSRVATQRQTGEMASLRLATPEVRRALALAKARGQLG